MLKSKKEDISLLGSTLAKRPSGPLEVGTPFYQDGQLQVRVYWKNRGGTHPPRSFLFFFFFRIQAAPSKPTGPWDCCVPSITMVSQSVNQKIISISAVSLGANEINETMCLAGNASSAHVQAGSGTGRSGPPFGKEQ